MAIVSHVAVLPGVSVHLSSARPLVDDLFSMNGPFAAANLPRGAGSQ